jgi:hypothetical protein
LSGAISNGPHGPNPGVTIMSSPAFVIGKLTRIPQLSRTTDGTR